MGPRPFGRGRRAASRRANARRRALQWGRDLSVAEGRISGNPQVRIPGFNGAATFRSRKVITEGTVERIAGVLQWGRDLSVAEGVKYAFSASLEGTLQWGRDLSVAEGFFQRAISASTTRLQWGRDLSVAEGLSCGGGACRPLTFNGAATFRSRKGLPAIARRG